MANTTSLEQLKNQKRLSKAYAPYYKKDNQLRYVQPLRWVGIYYKTVGTTSDEG